VYAGVAGDDGSHSATVVASVPAQSTANNSTKATSSLTQLYNSTTPGVVDITVTSTSTSDNNGFFGPQSQQSQAEGSGFVYDSSGDIITNAHVVAGATSIKVRFKDGSTAKATLVGKDESTDIAVIKVSTDSSKLHPLSVGTSSSVQPGQAVVAFGSPFGLPGTMTAGIVSAVNRTITAPNQFSITGAIQTDAAINHGNSGGPLIDVNTNTVIGVNDQIESDTNDNSGVGFSVPINSSKATAQTLIAGGQVQHAYVGVRIEDVQGGAKISSIVAGAPADKAGLKKGDVITSFDGKAINSADDLTAAVFHAKPGEKVSVTITRNGTTQHLSLTLGVQPSRPSS
jgi:putative serine protease PepD